MFYVDRSLLLFYIINVHVLVCISIVVLVELPPGSLTGIGNAIIMDIIKRTSMHHLMVTCHHSQRSCILLVYLFLKN